MAVRDDEVRPKLGRIGDQRISYITRVLRTAEKAVGAASRSRWPRFTGARIGRGCAQGPKHRRAPQPWIRAAEGHRQDSRCAPQGQRSRRGAVHRYVQPDGVPREKEPGRLYGAATDDADGKAFIERSADDRHQFRFFISAEDGAELGDLKPIVRDLMRQ